MRGHCTSCVSECHQFAQSQSGSSKCTWLMSPRVEHCPRHQDEILLVQERVSPAPQFEGCNPVATQRPMMQWMQYEMAVAAGSHSVRAPCGLLKLFETDVVQGWKLPGPAKHRFFGFYWRCFFGEDVCCRWLGRSRRGFCHWLRQ